MTLTQKDINVIIEAHEKYEGNLTEADANLPYFRRTIAKYWKLNDLEFKLAKLLSEDDITEIIEAYPKYDGCISDAARNLPWSDTTIRRYWLSKGLKPKPKTNINTPITPTEIRERNKNRSYKDILEILQLQKTYGGDIKKAAKYSKYSVKTLKEYWKK